VKVRGGRRVRLGPGFSRLLAASAITNLGDGIRLAAGPLLVAGITSDPALVAGAVFVQQLPWLLVSLPAGAYVDRLDRRRLVVAVAVMRALLAAALCGAVAAGLAGIALLYLVLFAIGVAEVVADNAASALLPELVQPPQLPRANARLSVAFSVGNQFAGPPLGAWLFVFGAAVPFGAEAVGFAIAAALLATLPTSHTGPPTAARRRRGWLTADIKDGVRWLRRDQAVRLLALVLAAMNLTFMAAFAVWVLYARERLGLSGTGFGLLLTASAAGGLLGAALTGRLTDRFGPAALLRAGLLIETLVHVSLAQTRSPWVAGATMVLFGAHATVWGVVVVTLRQRLVPPRLLGRVNSVYFLLTMGGAAVGALAGGFLARALGLVGPFWLAAAANAVLTAAVWQRLNPTLLPPAPPTEPQPTATAETAPQVVAHTDTRP
jgi:MFS family permease